MSFGKGGAQRIEPFNREDRGQVIDPLIGALMPGLGGYSTQGVQRAIGATHPLEGAAIKTLGGPTGPQSFLQGGQGYLGKAGGLFSKAQGMVGSDPLGARGAFGRFLSEGFTDVQNDPHTQALLAAQAGQAQEFLNRNLGDIGAAAQRASGGVASGSGEVAAKTRATTQAGEALGRQQAETLFGEQARRQGVQLAAAQQGLGQGLREAAMLGQLGSGLGQLGLGAGGLGSQLLGQQIGLGGQLQGRDVAAQMYPLQQIFQLADLLKSTSGVRQPGFMEHLANLGTGLGGMAMGYKAIT